MRIIGIRLGANDAVNRVGTFPPETPDRIFATYSAALSIAPVSAARLEWRLRLNDDVNAVYAANWDAEHWECRRDRHDNDHNSREHFLHR